MIICSYRDFILTVLTPTFPDERLSDIIKKDEVRKNEEPESLQQETVMSTDKGNHSVEVSGLSGDTFIILHHSRLVGYLVTPLAFSLIHD